MRKLQTHFGQANEDLNTILTSAGKIEKRAARIEELEFDGDESPAGNVIAGAGAQDSSGRVNSSRLHSMS